MMCKNSMVTRLLVGTLLLSSIMPGALVAVDRPEGVPSVKKSLWHRLVGCFKRTPDLHKEVEVEPISAKALSEQEKRRRHIKDRAVGIGILTVCAAIVGGMIFLLVRAEHDLDEARRKRMNVLREALGEEQESQASDESGDDFRPSTAEIIRDAEEACRRLREVCRPKVARPENVTVLDIAEQQAQASDESGDDFMPSTEELIRDAEETCRRLRDTCRPPVVNRGERATDSARELIGDDLVVSDDSDIEDGDIEDGNSDIDY